MSTPPSATTQDAFIGVDVGGTHTDVAAVVGDRLQGIGDPVALVGPGGEERGQARVLVRRGDEHHREPRRGGFDAAREGRERREWEKRCRKDPENCGSYDGYVASHDN